MHGDYRRLVGWVALACGSLPLAEDAVQEALARAWERSERGEHIRSWRAWVATVALNLARSRLRRVMAERRATERLTARRPSIEEADPAETAEARADVRRALAALPRRQREAIVLRFYLGHDTAEIATALRMTEGAVKTTLYRARRALAATLAEPEAEEAIEVVEG